MLNTRSSLLKHLSVYPLLMAWWFLLVPYTNNLSEQPLRVMLLPFVITTTAVLIVWLTLRFITRSQYSASALTMYIVCALMGFGYIQEWFGFINHAMFSGRFVIAALILGFAGLVVVVWRGWLNTEKISPALTMASAMLVVFNIILVVQQTTKVALASDASVETVPVTKLSVTSTSPDVYYIVPDRYPSNQVLTQWFNFDNSAFLNELAQRGFVVNNTAHSNYQFTTQSLASTLNGEYLDAVAAKYDDKTTSLQPLQHLIQYNWVARSFKAAGYYVANLGSWWGATRTSPIADYSLAPSARIYKVFGHNVALDEYSSLVVGRSAFQIGLRRSQRLDLGDITPQAHAAAFQLQLQALKDVTKTTKPKYVFTHMLMPHPPFVYDADGTFHPHDYADYEPSQYIAQIQYANSKILEAIDYINAHSRQKPIIILQADEGPYPGEGIGQNRGATDWAHLSNDLIAMKTGTLQAVQYPNANIDTKNSAVNQFRYVFNQYFGAKLPLLPVKEYYFPGKDEPYHYRDVTGAISSE